MFYRDFINTNIPICWLSTSVLPLVLPITPPSSYCQSPKPEALTFPSVSCFRLHHFQTRPSDPIDFSFILGLEIIQCLFVCLEVQAQQLASLLLVSHYSPITFCSCSCQGLSKSWFPSPSHLILGSLLSHDEIQTSWHGKQGPSWSSSS